MEGQRYQHVREVTKDVRLWTHSQALKAVPYVRAILRSLRESWLEAREAQVQLERLDSQGNRDRQTLMMRDEISAQQAIARTRFDEGLDELEAMNIRCIDVVKGIALIPFVRREELAWFVFDLFSSDGLVAWRFDSDPLPIRRNLARQGDPAVSSKLSSKQVDLLMSQVGEQRT